MIVDNKSVEISDLILKTQSFLKIYGESLEMIKKNQPEEWSKQLESAKSLAIKYQDTQLVVEMFALCQVEYENDLRSGNVSPLVKSLKQYAESNSIIK